MYKHPGKILLLWSAFIMLIMGIPGNYFPNPPKLIQLFSPDKIIHLFLFSIFYILIYKYLRINFTSFSVKKLRLISILSGTIYGASTELLQAFVFVGRSGNYVDWIADNIGVILGMMISSFLQKKITIK